jgi:hypothetical protein
LVLTGLGDNCAAVRVADQGNRGFLGVDYPARGGDVARQGQGRVLHHAHAVAARLEQFIDPLPARSIDETTVNEHDGGRY